MAKSSNRFETWRILVVDDEAALHGILRELLEHCGANVHVTETGDDAVRIWTQAKEAGNPFQLVITDLSLGGGLDGIGVARQIRTASPQARILACTGSSADPIVDSPTEFGFDGCLAKPFLLQELIDMVHEVGTRT
jgi:two-component system, cell cycle sensor histidine kinase and response regulator CckA